MRACRAAARSPSQGEGWCNPVLALPTIVLAARARGRARLPQLPADGQSVWTSREALTPPSVPKRLLIVGAGAIGIEFASFYRAGGAGATVVEMAPRVLPLEDDEVSAQVAASLKKDGIHVHTQVALEQAQRVQGAWQLTLGPQGSGSGSGSALQVQADVVLVAAGIVGNVEDLGLDKTRVQVEKTHIVTDAQCRTAEPGVYAIGDVAGPPWLARTRPAMRPCCA